MRLLSLFASNLLPVMLIVAIGAVLRFRSGLRPRSLTAVAFHVFSPCLLLQLILDQQVPAVQLARMASFAVGILLVGGAVAALACRLWKVPRSMTAATVLAVLVPNTGNFGLSVHGFAFGEAALAQAGLYFVGASVLAYTGGVLVASMGRQSLGRSLLTLTRLPAIWAVIVAVVMVERSWSFPGPFDRTVDLLAGACIPTMLVILGMQLAVVRGSDHFRLLGLAVALRLLVMPAVAAGAVFLLGWEGPLRQAAILQTGMPTAVVMMILATEYDTEPGFVTLAVLVSTLLAPFTLTPLLALLGA